MAHNDTVEPIHQQQHRRVQGQRQQRQRHQSPSAQMVHPRRDETNLYYQELAHLTASLNHPEQSPSPHLLRGGLYSHYTTSRPPLLHGSNGVVSRGCSVEEFKRHYIITIPLGDELRTPFQADDIDVHVEDEGHVFHVVAVGGGGDGSGGEPPFFCSKSFLIGDDIDTAQLETALHQGVLRVKAPKKRNFFVGGRNRSNTTPVESPPAVGPQDPSSSGDEDPPKPQSAPALGARKATNRSPKGKPRHRSPKRLLSSLKVPFGRRSPKKI